MTSRFLLFLFAGISLSLSASYAQTACPGCITRISPAFPDDTLYMSDAPVAFAELDYDADISFRLPKTTTPVNAVDSTTPPGFPISKFRINNLGNLPAGLRWQLGQSEFDVDVETDGCVKICGIPAETGYFLVEVQLTATLFGIAKDASFTFPLTVYPRPNNAVPMQMFGDNGCGETTVTFFNNVRSNGDPRFSYSWDFGNGTTSTAETPAPVTYARPGQYVVRYEATVDTAGYQLSNVRVTATTCEDFSLPPFISGKPDLYVVVEDANRREVYRSPVVTDASVPVNFNINLPLTDGSYALRVFDQDDGGLGGDDDFCGEIVFDRSASGSFVDRGLTVTITTYHPVIKIQKTDTVTVYEKAPVPVISPSNISVNCRDTLTLQSSETAHIQWYFEGNRFAQTAAIQPDEPGRYWVVFRHPTSGCTATSDTAFVPELVLPPTPFFHNDNNWLVLTDTNQLPRDFHLQWYLNGASIQGENDFKYCARQSGKYALLLTDNATGCTANFEANIAWNPNFNCLVGTRQPNDFSQVSIYPNPTSDSVFLKMGDQNKPIWVAVYDPSGKVHLQQTGIEKDGEVRVTGLPAGLYYLKMQTETGASWTGKFVKQ